MKTLIEEIRKLYIDNTPNMVHRIALGRIREEVESGAITNAEAVKIRNFAYRTYFFFCLNR